LRKFRENLRDTLGKTWKKLEKIVENSFENYLCSLEEHFENIGKNQN
jgi:hypothetical protein